MMIRPANLLRLSMYDYSDIEFALCAIFILWLIFIVAIVAFMAKSRTIFITGTIGSFLGHVVPEPQIHINGTGEQIFMSHLHQTAEHIFLYGLVGAVVCCIAVVVVQRKLRKST